MHRPRSVSLSLAAIASALTAAQASAQLRVVSHNVRNTIPTFDPTWNQLVRDIGTTDLNGVANRPAVWALQEIDPGQSANLANFLDQEFASQGGNYQSVEVRGNSFDNQGIVYDASQLTLLSNQTVAVGTRNGQLAQFRPVGYDSPDADIWFYNVHLKAFPGEEGRRLSEVQTMRFVTDLTFADPSTNIVYIGDFNFTSLVTTTGPQPIELAYDEVLAPHPHQAFDPAEVAPEADPKQYTFSTSGPFSRIDFQFPTTELGDDEGLDLIGSDVSDHNYIAYGNDGTPAVPFVVRNASDHLPVVADYQLPAWMQASVEPLPEAVIVDAPATAEVEVENIAPVVSVLGADELDYDVTGTGAVIGTASGTDLALGGGNTHTIVLDTTTAGAKTGEVVVTAEVDATQDGSFSQGVSYAVLDHANASFSGTGDVDVLLLDFGAVTPGTSPMTLAGSVFNLESLADFTAALDLDAIEESDTANLFDLSLNPFAELAAGDSVGFVAMFDPSAQLGSFTATYVLRLSDEDLLGAADQQLTLRVTGTVVPEPTTVALLGLIGVAAIARRAGPGTDGEIRARRPS